MEEEGASPMHLRQSGGAPYGPCIALDVGLGPSRVGWVDGSWWMGRGKCGCSRLLLRNVGNARFHAALKPPGIKLEGWEEGGMHGG